MNLKEKIFLLSIVIFMVSCDYGNNLKDFGTTIYKIYTFNLSDSTLHEISDGLRPITLFQADKLLFVTEENFSSKVWLYDFSTKGKEILANDLHPPLFDDSVVSPDEKHLVFIKDKKLKLMDLNSGNVQVIDSSSNELIHIPVPKFSNDGKYIVYISSVKEKMDSSSSKFYYLNIYNIVSKSTISIDTAFVKGHDRLEAKFTNDSKKVYMLRDGWHPSNFRRQFEFTIYSLEQTPKLFRKKTIYTFDYRNNSWNIEDDKILILDRVGLREYDIKNDILTKTKKIDISLKEFEIRKVKNLDYLIGADEENNIQLIDLKGEIKYKIKPKIEGQIYWADYFQKHNYILFATSQYLPPQN
ncbi:MAG: hypothetical protein V3V16_02040 [Melioribacteraceae bacterium]